MKGTSSLQAEPDLPHHRDAPIAGQRTRSFGQKPGQRDPNAIVVLTSAFGTTQAGHRVYAASVAFDFIPQRDAAIQSEGRVVDAALKAPGRDEGRRRCSSRR
jgi:hypothetical protein